MMRRHPKKDNVLLVNITRLGDMLQATPTIAGIKAENPNGRITVLVEKQFEDICHIIPGIDEVKSLDLGMTVRSLSREQDGIIDAFEYISEFVEDLRSKNFDFCLNMSSSGYTALLLKMLDIKGNGGWTADEEGNRRIESDWAKLFASSVFHQNRQYNSLNLVDVFRCSADVVEHPNQLQLKVPDDALSHAEGLIREAGFTNSGSLIAIQAGASQVKRQWSPQRFVDLIEKLLAEAQARVILIGSKKELKIINAIKEKLPTPNVAVFAGKTSIPQLAGVLKLSDILVTGDTGPMHMSVAVGTPVVAMFLASAFGFETGPYSEGNIVLQPVIGCGPCNPNKTCAGLECHDTIDPQLMAYLTLRRLREDFTEVPPSVADPKRVIVYRSFFDQFGFCDFKALNSPPQDLLRSYRDAYRKLWLNDLGGFDVGDGERANHATRSSLELVDGPLSGLTETVNLAEEGTKLIGLLSQLIADPHSSGQVLTETTRQLSELDRRIEEVGFHHSHLGPVTRMFVFAKENLFGSDALDLASQMGRIYEDLKRRCSKLEFYARA